LNSREKKVNLHSSFAKM